MKRALFLGLGFLALNSFLTLPAHADCTPPPAGLVAWWPGDGNANDIFGANNGFVTNGVTTYTNGEVGLAFNYNGAGSYVEIPASSALNVGLGAGFTLEGWIKPNDLVSQLPLFEWQFDGVEVGVHFWTSTDGGAGCLFANVVDTNNNAHSFYSAAGILTTNYQHVALTYDKTTGIACIYRNGVIVASQNLGVFTPKTQSNFLLGARTYLAGATPQFIYSGSLDEMSICNRALATNEIAAIYNAGSAGKCLPASDCTPPPAGLVAWWPGEGNDNDVAGTNNGTAQNINYTSGQVGQAFVFDGSSSYVQFPAGPTLDVGQGEGLTVEAWINPENLNLQALFEWNQNNGIPYGAGQIGAHFEINESSGDGSLWGILMDTSGVAHTINSDTGIIVTNQFQHVAMTYDKTSGAAILYCNGVMVATNNLGFIIPQTSFDLFLGNRPSGFFAGDYFQGEMDEPSVYSRALSPSEIAAIYNAGSAGKCTSGASIIQQPLNQITVAGSSATLTVGMGGIGPFTYQWRFNGTNISGATNATLTLANLHSSQSGHYSVVITTPDGTLISSDAVVTVIPQDILIYSYSGKEQVTTFSQDLAYNYSGQMLLIPAGTNGTFVGWANINGKKQYWVSPLTDYLWITIAHKNNRGYTVLGRAGDGIDTNGYPHLWSSLHRGVNTQLTIAKKRTFSFPNTFSCVDNHIYPDTNTGNLIIMDASSTYQFAPANTQTANNAGQTLTDLINTLTKSLEKQGYQTQ